MPLHDFEPSPGRTLSLRLHILRLRLRTFRASRRLRAIQKKARRKKVLRRWPYVVSLVLCFVAAVCAIVISIMAQGVPVLRRLDGSLPGEDGVVVLDPNKKDETMLSEGYLYDRPIAAVQTGSEQLLLRMRLEETLLNARKDVDGNRVVVEKQLREPGENWEARTITQQAALQLLQSGGYCKTTDTWDTALEKKLPAKRLPGGDNDGGRLLVFEQRTVVADPDSPIPDISVMLPEDIEAYNLGQVTYAYTGFLYINDNGTALYQPLHIILDDAFPRQPTEPPPEIIAIDYDFYQWEVIQASVHIFSENTASPVNIQLGSLHPIAEWTKPSDAWYYDADGWVYYGRALTPGTMTPLLMKSFTVWPGSPLVQEETRYRLHVRTQSAPLDQAAILQAWHDGAPLESLGSNTMSNEAAVLVQGVLAG